MYYIQHNEDGTRSIKIKYPQIIRKIISLNENEINKIGVKSFIEINLTFMN